MAEGKGKRKLNKKALLIVFLTLYLIIMAFYYVFTLPIKNIVIKGNNIITNETIINAAGIDNYPKIITTWSKDIIKNVKKINEIKDVKVKKSLSGQITIEVTEINVLFYNNLNSKYVLADGTEIDNVSKNFGIPVLVNYVPSDIYASLIAKMAEIDANIIAMINEIEYNPHEKDGVVLDNNRFILRMNDGNYVKINLANFENLNRYKEIYATLNEKVIIFLDSSTGNVITKSFDALKAEEAEETEKEVEDNELSQ